MYKQHLKGFFSLVFLVFLSLFALAQGPQKINYQAVARDIETGNEIAGQSIFLVAKILSQGPGGNIVYQEQHADVVTNDFGLFQIQIGGGEIVQGSFESIDWGSGDFWLEVDIDVGNGMETMGAMQFVAVPYALHAETVSNTDDADADPTNELITSATFDPGQSTITILEGLENELEIDLSEIEVADADADPTNELITSASFDAEQNTITILEGLENELAIDLSSLDVDDDDPDPTNELITSIGLMQDSILVIEDQNTWSVNLGSFIDDDPDPENELIDADGLTLVDDTILQISEAGILHEVNLAGLRDDDWKRTDAGNVIYNNEDRVGIGTSVPTSTFHANSSVSYKYRIFDNTVVSNVNVEDDDHYLILKLDDSGSAPLTINLPNAVDVDGRILVVRRTGDITSVPVSFEFGSDDLNFGSTATPLVVGGFFNQTLRFMSLGENGWVTIDYAN